MARPPSSTAVAKAYRDVADRLAKLKTDLALLARRAPAPGRALIEAHTADAARAASAAELTARILADVADPPPSAD